MKVKVIVLTVRRKCIIILCRIDTCGHGEDQKRNLGVKDWGSGTGMSKGTGDSGVAKIRKGTKTSRVQQPWWQRDIAVLNLIPKTEIPSTGYHIFNTATDCTYSVNFMYY